MSRLTVFEERPRLGHEEIETEAHYTLASAHDKDDNTTKALCLIAMALNNIAEALKEPFAVR